MAKDSFWFRHDATAQDDPKCMILIDQLGMEGYGIFWALIEKLRNEANYQLPLSTIPSFARRWGTSKEKVETVILKFSLFMNDATFFWSQRLTDNMNYKSEKARESISYRWNNTTVLQSNTTDIRNDTKKKRKEKKREEEDAPASRVPLFEEVKEYFLANGYPEELAKKAFFYYDSHGWKDSKGNSVKSWKHKMQAVWFKNENKIDQKKMVI